MQADLGQWKERESMLAAERESAAARGAGNLKRIDMGELLREFRRFRKICYS